MDTDNAVNSPKIRNTRDKPQPTLITTGPEVGTRSLNYRSEPLSFRIANMDPSHGFASIDRRDPDLNRQGDPGKPISPMSAFTFPAAYLGAAPYDPYTPLLRAYENDDVQVRVLIGAHFLPHSFNLYGLKWLNEAGNPDSGYVSTQVMSISEHFEMLFRLPPSACARLSPTVPPAADYLYMASSDTRGLLLGDWGILRAYQGQADGLYATPTNPEMAAPKAALDNIKAFYDGLIAAGKVRQFNVYAVMPTKVKNVDGTTNPDGLVYYSRGPGKLTDPDAVIYVTDEMYDPVANQFRPGFVPEPLILRANAGDLIQVKLTNKIPLPQGASVGQRAGLHAQLVTYDVTTSDGFNGGNNKNQTAEKPGDTVEYQWYAGNITVAHDGKVTGEPAEFGSVSLTPSDPASSPAGSQISHGLLGALVIEPEGSTWVPDTDSRAQATVTLADGATQFREFVLVVQDLVPAGAPDGLTQLSSQVQGINYKSELMPLRIDFQSGEDFPDYNEIDISDATADVLFSATSDPQTPIYHSPQGLPVRFRVLHPGGGSYTPMNIHGHVWKQTPTKKGTGSLVLGNDSPSLWLGSLGGLPPNSQFNLLIDSAGGGAAVPGDYLYRGFESTELQYGLWGVFRVGKKDADDLSVASTTVMGNEITVTGKVWKKIDSATFAASVSLLSRAAWAALGTADVNPTNGSFVLAVAVIQPDGAYRLVSAGGGEARVVVHPQELRHLARVRSMAPAAGDRRASDVQRFLPQGQAVRPRRQGN